MSSQIHVPAIFISAEQFFFIHLGEGQVGPTFRLDGMGKKKYLSIRGPRGDRRVKWFS